MFNLTSEKAFIKQKKQVKSIFTARYALIFLIYIVLFFVFSSTKLFGNVTACNYGVFISLALLEQSITILISFLIANILTGVTTWKLVFYFLATLIVFVVSIFFKIKKKACSNYIVFATCFIISVVNFLLNFSGAFTLILNCCLNILSSICFCNVYKIFKNRRFNFKLETDEIICFGFILCLFFCGVGNLNVFVFDIVKFLGISLILFSIYIFPLSGTMLIAVLSGLGASLSNGHIGYIALFSLVIIFGNIFKNYNKIFVCITTLCIDLCFSLFFNAFTLPIYYLILPTLLSLAIFIILSKKQMEKLRSVLFLNEDNFGLKDAFNESKELLSQKLLFTSEVFYEMDKNFRGLLQNKLDEKTSKLMICNEVLRENCENCENKTKCIKNFDKEIKNVFSSLTNVGFEKGKITLIDLPSYLTNRCVRVNSVVNSYNVLLNKYKQFCRQKSNIDNSKILIADQLKGISNILKKLAQETSNEIATNLKLQKIIKENLTYSNIVPVEVVCFEKDLKTNVVELFLRNVDFDAERIKEVLFNVYKSKMVVEKIKTIDGGTSICVRFVTAPTFDVSVGFCQMPKGGEEVCGDTYTLTKLQNDKFLLGVCDGMGHGEKANRTSEIAINIIENFYKAGFDNQTILTSVNLLLSLQQDETFSALDVGVIDLKTGEIDFIKQGGTSSYIISKTKIFKIESSGLPLGILSEIKPKVVKTVLTPEDAVIIVSDGIIDSFENVENFEEFLQSLNFKNPQEMAEKILNKAKRNVKNYPNDDMTVIVGKLFYF